MTQGENVNPYPRKQKRQGKFPIKEKAKKKGREGKFPIKGKKEARKFPIKEWEKAKRKERKFPIKEWEKVKKEEEEGKKAPDQGSKENRRNVQKGLWTGQYLNNTELSPYEQKEGKETTT